MGEQIGPTPDERSGRGYTVETTGFLATVSDAVSNVLDAHDRFESLLRLAVPRLADCCILDLVEASAIRRAAAVHADPGQQPLLDELLRRFPIDPHGHIGVPAVLRSGEAVVNPHLDAELRRTAGDHDGHFEILRRLRLASSVVVPLRARRRTVGALTLLNGNSRPPFERAHLSLIEEFAQRVALAVDNAALFAAEQRARHQAEQAVERLERLQALTAALVEAASLDRVVSVILDHGLAAVRAKAGVVYLVSPTGTDIRLAAAVGYGRTFGTRWGTIPLATPTPLTEAVIRGEPVWYDSSRATWTAFPALRGELRRGTGARAAIPLATNGRRLGVLGLTFAAKGPVEAVGRSFVTTIARQASLAVERALAYRQEQEARAAADRLAEERGLILQGIADGVLIADADGRVRPINAAAAHLLGVPESATWGVDRPGAHRVSRSDGTAYGPGEAPLARALRVGETLLDEEILVSRPDGSEIRLAVSAAPIRGGADTPVGAVLTLHDVSARREVERQKDEFFHNVSHDLRTPLTAIKASIGVVLDHQPAETPDALRRMFRNIDAAADRMMGLIDDLLELSRLQAGRVQLTLARGDLRDVVDEAVRLVQPMLESRRQRLLVDLPARAIAAAFDRPRLERALVNLLSNAHKFGPAGGVIALSLARRPGEAVISVRDDGPGIPETERERIFERFYRSPSETTARSLGSGLGLPIARAMIELHGGRVWVDGGETGTTFRVVLPTRANRR